MHLHPNYEKYLKEKIDGLFYDGPIYEWDEEDYIEYEQKLYRLQHPDRFWWKMYINKKRKRRN